MISAIHEMIEEARKKAKSRRAPDGEGTHSLEKASPQEEIRGKASAWLHVLRRATRQTRANEQDGVVGDSAPNKARQGYNQPRSRF